MGRSQSLINCTVALLLGLVSGCVSPAAQQKGPFQVKRVRGLGKPMVEIENDTDLELTLELSGAAVRKMIIKPKSKESVRLAGGNYHYKEL